MSEQLEMDPEVLADLQLRAASERDPTRTRGAGVYDWKPAPIVGASRCRRPGCGGHVGVDADAIERLEIFNRILARQGEHPILTSSVAFCDDCRVNGRAGVADRKRREVDELAETIREIKQHPEPRGAHELIRKLTKLHHPDVSGLLESLAAKLESGANKAVKARSKKL